MAEYELVREIKNQCPNNQMRDIYFEEVETDDPAAYVTSILKGNSITVTAEQGQSGVVIVYADCDGMLQKFIFTPI